MHYHCSRRPRRAPVSNRAGKYKQIREILEPLPDRRFDTSTIRVQYVTGFGTAYVDAYEQVRYGLNATQGSGVQSTPTNAIVFTNMWERCAHRVKLSQPQNLLKSCKHGASEQVGSDIAGRFK